ncbi:MAG: alpha/beta hydrolase family protein [Planctomycetaceae bacterium]
MTNPNLSPRPSRRVRFPGGSGFELAGIIDHAAGADAERPSHGAPVVVFSHCFTCNKDLKAIVRISRAMAASGITVLRFDMTGLGGSDGDFSHTNFTTNIADLRAAIRFAASELGPLTGLIGHSFGGAASLAVAGDPQEAAISLRAIATIAAPADTQHLADLLDWMNPQIESAGLGDVEIGGRRWTIRREMTADFRRHHLGDLIARIAVPLAILHSASDETVSFDQALRIYQLASVRPPGVPAPAVSLLALDGADHLLANKHSDLIYTAEILSAFFRRHSL